MDHPAPLSYDSLPEGSDIRIDYAPDEIHITVPASEPPRSVLKQTVYDSFVRGSWTSVGLLALSYAAFHVGIRTNRITGPSLIWAWAFFAIFCAALVLLVSWVSYSMLIDAVRAGRQQMTILVATRDRLLIETTGPFGVGGYDLPRQTIRRLHVTTASLRDRHFRSHRVATLAIELIDGRAIYTLPARARPELTMICAACRSILQ